MNRDAPVTWAPATDNAPTVAGLSHHVQEFSARGELGRRPVFGFALRQTFVVGQVPCPVHRQGVVTGPAHVQAKLSIDVLLLQNHENSRHTRVQAEAWAALVDSGSMLRRTRRWASFSDRPAAKPIPIATPPSIHV